MSFPLAIAEQIAQRIAERVAPHAERIEIAGSIRRQRATVNDIDLVVIPKLRREGLFATDEEAPQSSALAVQLCSDLLGQVLVRGNKQIRGTVLPATLLPGDLPVSMPAIQVDVFFATPESWATLLVIKTGSAQHNIFLCTRARELGGVLHASGDGLDMPFEYDAVKQRNRLKRVVPESEAEIFSLLLRSHELEQFNIEQLRSDTLIPPERRECDDRGTPSWMPRKAAPRPFAIGAKGSR